MPEVYRRKSCTIEIIPHSVDSNLVTIKDTITVGIFGANYVPLNRSNAKDADFAFYKVNLGSVVRQFIRWKSLLPRVQPFFAVKCQPDPKVIELLGKLGAGFDCASKEEIRIVSKTMLFNSDEVSKSIIYANPYKFRKDIIYASRRGVTLTTFDTEGELIKLSKEWPSAQLVLRLSPQRSYDATCVLGNKFGCDPDEVPTILHRAKELSMDIVGLSFHVGSGCKEMNAFPETVTYCSKVMELARQIGFNPYLLDIGGGFPGLSSINNDMEKQIEFEQMCSKLRSVLDTYFPEEENYQIIAEPGRYFVMGAYTLATQVIGKRHLDLYCHDSDDVIVACNKTQSQPDAFNDHSNSDSASTYSLNCDDLFPSSYDAMPNDVTVREEMCDRPIKGPVIEKGFRYVINDGVYNSFNCIVFDHAQPFPYGVFDDHGYFKTIGGQSQYFVSTVYGPTCDGFDCVLQQVLLPQMEVGDWLVWPDMGAYTVAACSSFNGIQVAERHYFMCADDLCDMDKVSASLSRGAIPCGDCVLLP